MTTTAQPRLTSVAPPEVRRRGLAQFRLRYAAISAGAILLALLTLLQAVSAYRTAYEMFRGIAEVNATTVDASEQALQYIAQASQAAADYTLLTSDTPLYEQAQNNIFRSFSAYRDELFTLRDTLQSGEEQTAFTTAETFTYSRFWRHVSNLVANRSDDALARREYLDADNHVRVWITPALQELERLNFEGMVEAGENAASVIAGQLVLFVIPGFGLAALLTYLSFMLRGKIRRYLTPGLDLAVVAAWVLALLVTLNLADSPNKINVMIQDAYRSVSASARALVDANLANRAESSLLLDPDSAESWEARYDDAVERVMLRLCGEIDCTALPFTSGGDQLLSRVVSIAEEIAPTDSARIDGIVPLVANVTFPDEASALEEARLALEDFRAAHVNLRAQIDSGRVDDAILFNTSADDGTSQAAFDRFSAAIDALRQINRDVFDQTWTAQRDALNRNLTLFGVIGYALIAVLIAAGIVHRYREL
jgi:hypothetical protein